MASSIDGCVPPKPAVNWANSVEPMPTMTEWNQHEAGQRRQLEFNQGDEELDRENEEGEQHHHPREEQHRDLDEVLEERDVSHEP
jgi:hypothetical protein